MGKTWDDREGEEKENNEEAMQLRNRGFPPLALCIKTMMIVNDKLSILSYPPHPTPHTRSPHT
ncbi:hypothetical protein [Moorena producens]|uniref:hypothetical protein n=1 Tax=Moorena producens TaxID=1155739 RepID=UPI003C74F6A3